MNNSFGGGFGGQSGMRKRPVITDIVISAITDTGFTVTALVNPKGATLTPRLKFGETTSYGTMINASGGAISIPSTVTFVLSGLDSWTTYNFQVIAGISVSANNMQLTNVPSEMADGNWYAKYEYNHASNVVDGSNFVSQLRDIEQGNVESAEVFVNGGFDTDTGWTKGAGWAISGGKAEGVSGVQSDIYQTGNYTDAVYRIKADVDSVAGLLSIIGFRNAPLKSTTGFFDFTGIATINPGIRKFSSTNCSIDNFSLKKIKGNHLTQHISTTFPVKSADYIEFDGINDSFATSVVTGVTAIGTVYALVQRVGTDSVFNTLNSLTGIGAFTSNKLLLGMNGTIFHNVRVKALYVRKQGVTDSAPVVSKINKYLKKKSDTIDAITFGAVPDDSTDNFNLLQSLLDTSAKKNIVLGTNSSQVFRISQPLRVSQNFTHLTINGHLKLTDGHIRPLTSDGILGQNKLYVSNANLYYKIGQYVSVSSDTMPNGGGGTVVRKLGECSRITAVDDTSITLEDNLISNPYYITVGNFLVSANAKVGHTQSVFMIENADDITIDGSGIIDGNKSTQYYVHPIVIKVGDPLFPFENGKGGNGIVTRFVNRLKVEGTSAITPLTLQDFNIAGITGNELYDFSFKKLDILRPNYKCLAFTVVARGEIEDIKAWDSFNEDGVSLHDTSSFLNFKRIDIKNVTRIGLGIGSDSHDNTFEDITINNGAIAIVTDPTATSFECYNNTFTNVSVYDSGPALSLAKCNNYTFNNLNIYRNRINQNCIAIAGQTEAIVFNGGGVFDTIDVTRIGIALGFYNKLSTHTFPCRNIRFNDFEISRCKKAILAPIGTSDVTDVVFTNCVIHNNTTNGDIANAAFSYVGCTIT